LSWLEWLEHDLNFEGLARTPTFSGIFEGFYCVLDFLEKAGKKPHMQ
jgi:hypothetical protein